MKKHLAFAAGLAVLSAPAFATKARLEALQQTGRASFFLDDSRSVFLNAAKVNTMNNYVVTEWGTANAAADAEAAPHAEGGFFRKSSSLAYGLYLGNEYGANNATKTGANMMASDNNMELFVGGDMGVQWGARISYSANEDKPTGGIKKTSDTMGLGLGIISGDLEAYANLALKDESKGGDDADDSYEADMGTNIGLSYKMKGMIFHADYDKSAYEMKNAGTKTNDVEETTMTFGVARIHELSKGQTFFLDLSYVTSEEKDSTADTKTETTALPLTLGFETEANSWLTLRAAVSQNIVIGNEKVKGGSDKDIANSTNVSAGATMTWGNLAIDGMIGNTDGSRAGTVGTENGALTTDNLMTRVGVTYKF
jgi:hypothetical protein